MNKIKEQVYIYLMEKLASKEITYEDISFTDEEKNEFYSLTKDKSDEIEGIGDIMSDYLIELVKKIPEDNKFSNENCLKLINNEMNFEDFNLSDEEIIEFKEIIKYHLDKNTVKYDFIEYCKKNIGKYKKLKIKYLDEAIEFNPNNTIAYYERGILKADTKVNDFEGAIDDFNKLIEIDPKSVQAYTCRSVAKYRFGLRLAYYPTYRFETKNFIHESLQDNTTAINLLKNSNDSTPIKEKQYGILLKNRSFILKDLKRDKEAEECLNRIKILNR